MIKELRFVAEKFLNDQTITGAMATFPHLPGLDSCHVDDAMRDAGLKSISSWPYWDGWSYFTETSAVYISNGFGLCTNYTDVELCHEETTNPYDQKRYENVLSVTYTNDILSSTWTVQSDAFSGVFSQRKYVTDLKMGWKYRSQQVSEESYWRTVRDTIMEPVLTSTINERIADRILLHGDRSGEEKFQEVFAQAIRDMMPSATEIYWTDPDYAAARGAAEMAKRLYWTHHNTGKRQ